MTSPLVTIVTPSFNQGPFIRATIESVLNQDYPNLEYLIVDGGSTDDTAAIAAEYGDRLTFISEPDRGQSDAINKGFRRARGEIVAWLNSDDIFLPGAVSTAVAALIADPALGAVYGDGFQIDEHGAMISRFEATQPFDLWRLVHVSDYILQQTAFFRASALRVVGLCDESLHYGMDWELFMRIGKRYEMRYVAAEMGCIREYATTKTASGGARRWRELVSVMRRHGDLHYPPGMFVYGLDTFYPRVTALITRIFRGPAYGFGIRLNRLFTRGVFFLIYRAARYTQGIHADGWATRSAHLWFPNRGAGRVILDIECPDWPRLAGQQVRVSAGSRVQVLQLSPGLERYVVDVPAPASENEPIKVRLEAARTVPESAARRYRRDLAYLLRASHFEPAT
jgi:glycosyltransferase involved in cell wall biosynthesis